MVAVVHSGSLLGSVFSKISGVHLILDQDGHIATPLASKFEWVIDIPDASSVGANSYSWSPHLSEARDPFYLFKSA